MNYESARLYLVTQGSAFSSDSKDAEQTFLLRLQQGYPPLPGQATTILLALRIVFDHLQGQPTLDRKLALALHRLATQGLQAVGRWRSMGKVFPPLLEDDLQRIAASVDNIFCDTWR